MITVLEILIFEEKLTRLTLNTQRILHKLESFGTFF